MALRSSLLAGFAFLLAVTASESIRANEEAAPALQAIEKIAVFPVLYKGERGEKMDEATRKSLDETWWQVRDELTQTGRFVVASRAFLQKADAFQPRGALSVGDAVILGRYVEADALMTILLKDRSLTISIYGAVDGMRSWVQTVELHPSVLIREQVGKISRALVREFIASLPYQAVTVQDALAKQAVYSENGKRFVRIKVASSKVVVGDAVEWIDVSRATLEPLFQGGAKTIVQAEGNVSEIGEGFAVCELTRVVDVHAVRAGALVNLPAEQQRLAIAAKSKDSATSAAIVSLLAQNASIEPEAKQAERKNDESGPFATTLSILGSLALILLLAF